MKNVISIISTAVYLTIVIVINLMTAETAERMAQENFAPWGLVPLVALATPAAILTAVAVWIRHAQAVDAWAAVIWSDTDPVPARRVLRWEIPILLFRSAGYLLLWQVALIGLPVCIEGIKVFNHIFWWSMTVVAATSIIIAPWQIILIASEEADLMIDRAVWAARSCL